MKHQLQVIGFDGSKYWRLLFIKISDKDEVFYGLVMQDSSLCFSRHSSGKTNVKLGDYKVEDLSGFYKKITGKPFREFPPISKVTRLECLGTLSPVSGKEEISEKRYKSFISKRYNAVILLDLRNYKSSLKITPALVSPKYRDTIFMAKEFKKNSHVFIYTESTPWVVLYINRMLRMGRNNITD